MLSLGFGPFALAINHLVLLAALAIALVTGAWLARRRAGENPEKVLFALLLLTLLGARLAFVARYAPQYLATPWQIINVRDGGFLPGPGLGAGLLAAAWLGWRRPRLRVPLGAALAGGVLFWTATTVMIHRHQDGLAMPDVALQDAQGQPYRLRGGDSRPLVVNLWASWCPPCRREVPVLLQAQAQRPDVRFVFINQGEAPAIVANFVATAGLDHQQIAYDLGSQWGRQLGSAALPTTLFYSADRRLLGSHLGELSTASLADALRALQTQ